MHFLFLHYLTSLGHWIYSLVFAGVILEGDAVLLAAAFVASQGLLSIILVLSLAFLGVLVGDNLWYLLGRRPVRFLKPLYFVSNKVTNPFLKRIERTPFWFILLSKFTYGIHHLTLVRSGAMKMAYGRYLKIILLADVIWVLIVGSFGYFFAASFEAFRHYLRYGEVGLFLGLIVLVLVERFVRRLVNNEKV